MTRATTTRSATTRATITRAILTAGGLLLLGVAATLAAAATPAKPANPTRAHRAATAARPKPAAARQKPASAADAMPRTLEDVHIEGEIPVPQVLFITARDQRRFMDFQHHRFMRSSKQLGEETPYPTWIAVIHDQPIDPRKETSR